MNIKNFRSYYGDNTFEFAQGLTLIIGDNGDGKTTFFEALEWLFDTATENKSATNISEKRKSEMEVSRRTPIKMSAKGHGITPIHLCRKGLIRLKLPGVTLGGKLYKYEYNRTNVCAGGCFACEFDFRRASDD